MGMLVLMTSIVLLSSSCYTSNTMLELHRETPFNQKLESAVHRDLARQIHLVGDYNLSGDFNFAGIYYTKIALGSPPQEFHVQVDTGSNLLWVACVSCVGCPHTSALDIDLHFYNASNSSTASLVSCSDREQCSGCTPETNSRAYEVSYVDGSETSGELVTDLLQIHPIGGSSQKSSFPVTFGCSTKQTGLLATTRKPVDGILGFGKGPDSVRTQLSSQGIIPNVFSHCLSGGDTGGGILTMGEMMHPSMVFTPLIPHQNHYNVELLSISVGGKILPIRSEAFNTKTSNGIAVDSGTTLAYVVEEVFDPFITAINTYISKQAKPLPLPDRVCYDSETSGTSFYPRITLAFAGGANMVLKPEDYLFQATVKDGSPKWCMGFTKIPNGDFSILGELVLRDKIVTYDLYNQKLGWSTYVNCTSSVKVNSTYGFTNDGLPNSPKLILLIPIILATVIFLLL